MIFEGLHSGCCFIGFAFLVFPSGSVGQKWREL